MKVSTKLIFINLQLSTTERPQSNQNASSLEDSWFWEPEPETSSNSSSKKEDTGNGNGSPVLLSTANELTLIPLENNNLDICERLRKQLNEKEGKIKNFSIENSVLNEKLKNVTRENDELNKNIDELDKQHNAAIEELLIVKEDLQKKYILLEKTNETLKRENEIFEKKLLQRITENAQLQKQLEKDSSEENLLVQVNRLINDAFELNVPFENAENFLKYFAKWISSVSKTTRDLYYEKSKLLDENKLINEEANRLSHEKEVLKADLINYEIECSELMKNNNLLIADIENLKSTGKLETIPENDDEEINVESLETDSINNLSARLEEERNRNADYESEIKKLNLKISDQGIKLKSCADLNQENVLLQESISNLTTEKENLISIVKTKHEENVNYHNEIVRINNMLSSVTIQLNEKLNELSALKKEYKSSMEKLEKFEQALCDEQSKRKIIDTENVDLKDQNCSLNKEIERLRQHLLEMADDYTAQTIDLQKNVEEYKHKLISIEEEAKQASQTFTSAR